MERIVTGCYICKYGMWDSEGCFCKLNGAHALAPSIGCECQKVEQETDNNSSYLEEKAAKNSLFGKCASNQLDPDFCEFGKCPYYDKFCDHTLQDKRECAYLPHDTASNQLDSLEQRIDEFTEEYDTVLSTHAGKINDHTDALEEHLDRICDLEHLYEKILDDLCAMRDRLCKITDLLVMQDEYSHIFSNFCGNCAHSKLEDGIYACELSGEIIDPDSASCSMFEPPF